MRGICGDHGELHKKLEIAFCGFRGRGNKFSGLLASPLHPCGNLGKLAKSLACGSNMMFITTQSKRWDARPGSEPD